MARANTTLHFTKKCCFYKYHALLVKKSGSMKNKMKFGLKRYLFLSEAYIHCITSKDLP